MKIGEATYGDNASDPEDNLPVENASPPVSRLGDLWHLGPHRLLAGDATKPEDFERLLGGVKAAMVFTDPPYGVNYGSAPKDKMRSTSRPILNDNLGEEFGPFLTAACANILNYSSGAIYIAMASSALGLLADAFVAGGGHFSNFIIWAKQMFTLGRGDYQRQYEPILYGWPKKTGRYWCGARNLSDVWLFDKPARSELHPTQKPVALVSQAIRNSSERGSVVLDPFLGSGTTLIAAERTGRVCYGIELAPYYVDTIIRRWQDLTGGQAVHAETGQTFDACAAGGQANV